MINKTQTLKISLIAIGTFILGMSVLFYTSSKLQEKKSIPTKVELSVKKGGTYIKKTFVDTNDPFNTPIIDTVQVLDIQPSTKSKDLMYVKWTPCKFKDTTCCLSSELSIFTNNLEEIK